MSTKWAESMRNLWQHGLILAILTACQSDPTVNKKSEECSWCEEIPGQFYNSTPPYIYSNTACFQLDGGQIWLNDVCGGALDSIPHNQGLHADSRRAIGINELLLVGGGRASVCAIDILDRQIKWTIPLEGAMNANCQHSANSNRFFLLDESGVKVCSTEGEILVNIELEFLPKYSVANDDYLLCHDYSSDGHVAIIDVATHSVAFERTLGNFVNSSVITESNHFVFSCGQRIDCYNSSGDLMWSEPRYSEAGLVSSSGLVLGGYFSLWALDEETGRQVWIRENAACSLLQVADGIAYAIDFDIYGYEVSSGRQLLRISPLQSIFASYLVHDSLLVYPSESGICGFSFDR